MKYIALIGFALILFIPPIISIIVTGGKESPSKMINENYRKKTKYDRDFWEEDDGKDRNK